MSFVFAQITRDPLAAVLIAVPPTVVVNSEIASGYDGFRSTLITRGRPPLNMGGRSL
jgi:hypothetical protein